MSLSKSVLLIHDGEDEDGENIPTDTESTNTLFEVEMAVV